MPLTVDQQVQAYSRRLQEDPASLVFLPLAELYRDVGRLDEAVVVCREGLRYHDSLSRARLLLAELLLKVGDEPGALREADHLIHHNPSNEAARTLVERVRQAKRTHVMSTVAASETMGGSEAPSSGMNPGGAAVASSGTWVTPTMAELHVSQGLVQDAVGIYRQLVDREPGRMEWRRRLDELIAQVNGGHGLTKDQLRRLLESLKKTSAQLSELIRELDQAVLPNP